MPYEVRCSYGQEFRTPPSPTVHGTFRTRREAERRVRVTRASMNGECIRLRIAKVK